MLRFALNAHPAIHVFDERRAYAVLVGDRSVGGLLERQPSSLGFKVPRWTDLLPGPTTGDPDQQLSSTYTYGGEPILFIHRDVIDVVYSMQSLLVSGKPWLERYGLPLLIHRMASSQARRHQFRWLGMELLRSIGLESRIKRMVDRWTKRKDPWGALFDITGSGLFPSVPDAVLRSAAGALYWRLKNEALERYISQGYPVFAISYERFTSAPEKHLQEILAFLGHRWDSAVLTHTEIAHDELDARGLAIGRSDPQRSIDSASVGRGSEMLSRDSREAIQRVVLDLPQRMERLTAPW